MSGKYFFPILHFILGCGKFPPKICSLNCRTFLLFCAKLFVSVAEPLLSVTELQVRFGNGEQRFGNGEQRFGNRDKKFGTEEKKGSGLQRANLRRKLPAAQNIMQNYEKIFSETFSSHYFYKFTFQLIEKPATKINISLAEYCHINDKTFMTKISNSST